jgi:hypothetical protein
LLLQSQRKVLKDQLKALEAQLRQANNAHAAAQATLQVCSTVFVFLDCFSEHAPLQSERIAAQDRLALTEQKLHELQQNMTRTESRSGQSDADAAQQLQLARDAEV